MVRPSDDPARARFANELDRNFSVVASAGSGKTTAITQRVLSIARSVNAVETLPRLVVVTFANRAADEMQQRARQILLEENLGTEVQTAFNRAFFGTIHSFCMKLLTDFGHHLGLPAPLELLANDDDLWQEFVQSQTRIGHSLGEKHRTTLLRLVQARDLMELGRRAGSAVLSARELSVCPSPDFTEVYTQTDQGGRDNISKSQAELSEWEKRYTGDWEYLRWPVCFTAMNAKFTQLWTEKFLPLRKWVSNAATCVAAEVQRNYLDFRLERGLVTYGDQIALAKELLQHPIAAPRIREQNFCVILDEAQDTEPAQFSVLLETTRPADATGDWMETRNDPPRSGHFCMVGDFQQSIYRERADLGYYLAVHEVLVSHAGGEALTFSVTFRLDQKQLKFVNETFCEILNEKDGQVRFVELQPRPEILPGKVIRVPLVAKDLLSEGKRLKDYQKARIEAAYLAKWINNAGLKKLSASSWREVAILCPRKAWLQTMAAALRRIGLPVAIQSERDVKGDSPAYAWLTALCTIMTDPLNSYEIVGVLREIFGVSDHDLAVFSEAQKARFCIDDVSPAAGTISSQLRSLGEIRQRTDGLALFDALTLIVEKTQLRERLLLLPATEFGDLARDLDALLAQAAEVEVSGMILAEFAKRLRDDFTTPRNVRFSTDDNAIQLITSHKAKGSEWQAVIVPFLARDLRPPSQRYPHFVKSPVTGELLIALGKEDKSKELKDAIERAQQQELERLLYVATTRARHTLVLVLDQEVFSSSESKLPKAAQLRRLIRGADVYRNEFEERSSTIESIEESKAIASSPERNVVKIESLNSGELKRATKRASEFVHKFNPSDYDEEIPRAPTSGRPKNAPALAVGRSTTDTPATLYGRWWHDFIQRISWHDEGSWKQVFEEHQAKSPAAKRSANEWKLFLQYLKNDPYFSGLLTRTEMVTHPEMPFFWRMDEHRCLEGIVDLALFEPGEKKWFILDWKTKRDKIDILHAHYCPQIAAYWKAIAEMTGTQVEAGIYSTSTGELVVYTAEELAREWERLRHLQPDKLAAEIAPS
jgi:ATP-dependent exoDNAse (exonuclease V) beta subunit